MISRRPGSPATGAGTLVRAQRVLLFGALGMLLVSAALGDGSALGGGGGSGPALAAHVHAGSLGWLTLGVLAVAVGMLTGDGDGPDGPGRLTSRLSWLTVAAVAAFVVADWAGSAAAEAWTGAAALAAIVTFLVWLAAAGRRARAAWTVPRLAMVAALAVLVTGSTIGAVSAGDAAGGQVTGAVSLASSHSAVLVVPFVVLATTSVVEWSAAPAPAPAPLTTAGLVQVGALALAAAAVVTGVLGHDLVIVEANIPLLFGGIAIFLARVGPALLTAGWARSSRIWLVTSTVALAVDVGLFAHVVYEIGARRYVSIGLVPSWLLFTVDHVTFVAVGSTALFGAIAAMAGREDRWPVADVLAAAGLVLGLAATAAGIGAGSAALEGVSATVLGVSALAATAVAAARVAGVNRPRGT
jgi:hypothetical protein